ncbi:hypothetical protein [Pseudoxanthomonas putridarboris]|uniref:Bacteriophage coat protein B n=1 Tax=Pseudoxanthomonas putridarboris TaxID=752605 RepID=A0ABU9J0A5_9GAMM
MKKFKKFVQGIGSKLQNATVPFAAGASALALAPSAFATGAGSAIAAELSTGKAQVLLVVAALAVIVGTIILWRYVKRAG